MSETLVVDNSDINVRSELLAGDPGVHWFVTIVVVSCSFELFAKVINRGVVFGEPGIKLLSISWDQGVERCDITGRVSHLVRGHASLQPSLPYSPPTFRSSFDSGTREG